MLPDLSVDTLRACLLHGGFIVGDYVAIINFHPHTVAISICRQKSSTFLSCIAFAVSFEFWTFRATFTRSAESLSSRRPLYDFPSTAVQDTAFRRTRPPTAICLREICADFNHSALRLHAFDSKSILSSCPRGQFVQITHPSFASCRSPVDGIRPPRLKRHRLGTFQNAGHRRRGLDNGTRCGCSLDCQGSETRGMGRLTSASTDAAKDDASGRIRCGPCRYQTVLKSIDKVISE